MAASSIEQRIRKALGKAYLEKHLTQSKAIDLQAIADNEGASIEEIKVQINRLVKRGVLRTSTAIYFADKVPEYVSGSEHLTDKAGLDWANAGFPEPS